MADFFRRELEGDAGLKLFGGLHIALSAFFLILYILLIVNRRRLRAFGHFGTIRRVMATILFVNMMIHYTGRIAVGEWRLEEDLPFHLCFVANFFMMYILSTDNKHGLYRIIYFFTLIGPLPAIIWPDLHRSWSGYIFYQFIISHHIMLLFSLYCLFVLGYGTSAKSVIATFFIGNAYIGLMALFNHIFHTNYVMIGELPAQLYEVYPFLDRMPAIFWLELVGVLVLITAYIPARLAARHNDTAKEKRT
ncbi:MAG: TIGR02206 family membrane protein [Lachnospiraceae bacterium]|nr:TIGR02206 family membrane protein [Ruminococcus sp.]MCM1276406.1 TIGR02206 family membrane protein [Lachnospiraceae bacterium]